jgi:hypothetical protein
VFFAVLLHHYPLPPFPPLPPPPPSRALNHPPLQDTQQQSHLLMLLVQVVLPLGLKLVYTRLIGLVSIQGASCLVSHLLQTPPGGPQELRFKPLFS